MKKIMKVLSFMLLVFLSSTNAFATTVAPWDSALTKFVNLFKGKIALGIFFVVGFLAAWKLIQGGEMDEFTRKLLLGVVAVATIAGLGSLFSTLFGTAGYLLF